MKASKESTKPTFAGQAIVIPGEAPETDDELELEYDNSTISANLPKKGSNVFPSRQNTTIFTPKPIYDSLLHRKLREAQMNLATDAADFTGKATGNMNAEVQRVAQSVCASHMTLQDATCHIRSIAEDLYKIDDNLDAIFNSHSVIPDLANLDDFPTVKRYSKSSK